MKILVGLSGGVDSAVAAKLLIDQGHEVSGGFMINYTSETEDCTTADDLKVATQVADFLDIPFYTFDFEKEYEKRILTYLFEGYKQGITPNPDVFCNSLVKFDLFLEEALSYGFDAVATGHYVQSLQNQQGHMELHKGVDSNKDQSYFLSTLSEQQIRRSIFPIGQYEKSHIRRLAHNFNLPNADRKDSQGLCFVGKVNFSEFLEQAIPKKLGLIKDTKGNTLGEHNGAHYFTIGQRRGIGVGGGPAQFVIKKDVINNEVIVGHGDEPELYSNTCSIINMHWLHSSYESTYGESELMCKIRYRQDDQHCTLKVHQGGTGSVHFQTKQRAISPGQVVVFYDDTRVIGSAIIQE